jgi:uncharacterized protein
LIDYSAIISQKLSVKPSQVAAAVGLLDDDNTIPFIARYRKEATGTLDEEQLRTINSELERLRTLDERRTSVMASIEEQGKMTDELRKKLLDTSTMTELEDLYAPYKPKRKTRASVARERGLQPLADLILQQAHQPEPAEQTAHSFINDQVLTVEDALTGARDIVAETISDHSDVRRITREKAMQFAALTCEKIPDASDEKAVYESYYLFEGQVKFLKPHQVLAINRGETEKVLRVSVDVLERDWKYAITLYFRPDLRSPFCSHLELAIMDAAGRLLLPAIERDVRRELTVKAEAHAILVFAENLKALLGQPPLAGKVVLGIDPGFRTGSKVAVVDATGKLLETTTIYPHEPQKKWDEAVAILSALIQKHHVTLISIGNGTASRETEQLAAQICRETQGVNYVITNEAGASVYSASPLAKQEFPHLDVSLRGGVSIARRVQDPLAELVKIDPRSIGVGMYQHDVDQKMLSQSLGGVVEDVVNAVGVDVNTASPALLTYVAGIGPKLAEKMVGMRDERGAFTSREDLRGVPGLGAKAFEQAAGFLRIRDGKNPLDASAIHPESYHVATAVLERAGLDPSATLEQRKEALQTLTREKSVEQIAKELDCGVPTLDDILEQLVRPGRDPRQDAPPPILRSDVLKMEDLATGLKLKGTVRNVVDFGVFVDIGVKQDGLIHRTQLPAGNVLKVGDIIDVEIIKVEAERGRISLKLPLK